MSNKLYAERDIEGLDEDGNFYFKHVMAMTSENLSGKSAIAAELGYRDSKIVELQARLEHATNQRDAALAREAELVAQVEALRDAGNEVYAELQQWALTESHEETSRVFRLWLDTRAATPQQHLRDIQAEAGRAGYEIGFGDGWEAAQDGAMISPDTYAQEAAEDYADRIRRGEV